MHAVHQGNFVEGNRRSCFMTVLLGYSTALASGLIKDTEISYLAITINRQFHFLLLWRLRLDSRFQLCASRLLNQ